MVENARFTSTAYARLLAPDSSWGPPPPPLTLQNHAPLDKMTILLNIAPDSFLISCSTRIILEFSLESGEGDARFLRTGRQNGGLVICTPRARSDPSKQRNCRQHGVGPSKTAQLSSKPATERRLRLMRENDDLLLAWEP